MIRQDLITRVRTLSLPADQTPSRRCRPASKVAQLTDDRGRYRYLDGLCHIPFLSSGVFMKADYIS